jgi:hypothetical protein
MSKRFIEDSGELTDQGRDVVDEMVENMVPIFERYMDDGYNAFELLGVMTSALINAQKQAWINKVVKK